MSDNILSLGFIPKLDNIFYENCLFKVF